MSNNGQAIQAFNKKAEGGIISAAAPKALMVSGVALSGLAVFTAITPAPVAAIAKIADILNRVGLDKGPLFLFGATIGALGFALTRLEGARGSSSGSQGEPGIGEQIADDMEGQTAIMASLQGELGAARSEIAELRRETLEHAQSNDDNTATDPMFRLAASLDQLGAQIGKHLDTVAKNVQSSIAQVQISIRESDQRMADLSARVGDGSQGQQTASELQGLRDQISGLTQSVDSLSGQVEAIEIPVAQQLIQLSDQLSRIDADVEEAAELKAVEPEASQQELQLPRELTESPVDEDLDEPEGELTLGPEPAAAVPSNHEGDPESDDVDGPASHVGTPMDIEIGPIMAPESEPQESSEEEHAPLQLGEAPGVSAPSNESNQPTLFGSELTPVMPIDSEFPNPPAPMPQPSEGLELIDDMNEDKARIADLTPPLFPGLDGDGKG